MILGNLIPNTTVYHSLKGHFSDALGRALKNKRIAVALGPIYEVDPADEIVQPLLRSLRETGWVETAELCDDATTERILSLRSDFASTWLSSRPWAPVILDEWAKAGLVLEVASAWGINHLIHGKLRPRWKLRGTVTGRFGVEPVRLSDGRTFNPMIVAADERKFIVPDGPGRTLCSIDFKGMDLWSMVSLVPGLSDKYVGCTDPHMRTAEILFNDPGPDERDVAKSEVFVHAYGGHSVLKAYFEKHLPELNWLRSMPHGEGARLVQAQSAQAFRAALAEALPLLVDERIRPVMTVHDELVLDVKDGSEDWVIAITAAMENGAMRRIGQPYGTTKRFGHTYAEVKL